MENITKLKSYLTKKENEKSDKSKPRRTRSKQRQLDDQLYKRRASVTDYIVNCINHLYNRQVYIVS